MPLMIAPMGVSLNVRRVSGDEKVRRHLEALGIIPDQKISLLSTTNNGVIVLVNDSRLALDNQVARNIYVEA